MESLHHLIKFLKHASSESRYDDGRSTITGEKHRSGLSDVGNDSLGFQDNDYALCFTCASINITASIEIVRHNPDRILLLRFVESQNLQFSNPPCPLCNIIVWMRQAIPRHLLQEKMELVITTNRCKGDPIFHDRFGHWDTINIVLELFVWTAGGLCYISPRLTSVNHKNLIWFNTEKVHPPSQRYITPGFLDCKHIKQWFSIGGTEDHGNVMSCKPTEGRLQILPSRLIDCRTLKLVKVSKSPCTYFALSYVWGQKPHEHYSSHPKSLAEFPRTIRDAIQVTKQLGYRYLWVDRYCIDQDDWNEKHRQIHDMGSIYNNASLTIIAAAGADPSYGLPGVSRKRKEVPPTATILDWRIDAYPDEPVEKIRKSVWMTRAWTYQEALLSRRLLIFTDSQLYFECQGLTREDSYIDNKSIISTFNPSIFHKKDFGLRREEIFHYISEYSRRQLTFEEDRLNGFLGILGSLAEASEPIYHLFGVPLWPPSTHERTSDDIDRNYTRGLMMGMNWKVESGRRRRAQGSPSWSWVGWSGPVTWALNEFDSMEIISNSEAWMENSTGELLPLRSLYKLGGFSFPILYSSPSVLHVESSVFEVKVVHLSRELKDAHSVNIGIDGNPKIFSSQIPPGYWATWKCHGGMLIYTPVDLFEGLGEGLVEEVISQPQRLKVLVTGKTPLTDDAEEQTHGRLLRRVGGGYEVVGHVSFGCSRIFIRRILFTLISENLLPKMVRERIRLL
ncbi:HET-domain-containing protein [Annulohypoxylon stygium]|nr:HET-domain-containing protein [Annulohypoxylon stygium]